MTKMKLLQQFLSSKLTEKESSEVKGGRNYVPTNTGSNGYINWDDIDIRNDGLAVHPGTKLMSKNTYFNEYGSGR